MRSGSRRPSLPETPETVSDTGGGSSAEPGCAGFHTARDARNLRRFQVWMLAAGLAYVGATAALRWR
ncbi:MAG: hypothetical protein M3O15_01875, partial [Acidobacteriota bacterium]|nr:hypothetical protein [Acidobacteriota bacterium]